MSPLVSRTSTSASVRAEGQAPDTPPPSSPDSNGAIVETASAEGEVVHSVHAAQAAGVTPQSATSSDLDASTVVHPMDSADIECMLNAWTAAQTGADVNLSDATCFEHYFSNEVCDSEPLTIDFSKAPKYKFKAPVEDAGSHLNPMRVQMTRPYGTILGELSITPKQLRKRQAPADFDTQVDFDVFGEVMMVQDIETLKKRLKSCADLYAKGPA